jgi:multidrug efflux pump subunit AcrB
VTAVQVAFLLGLVACRSASGPAAEDREWIRVSVYDASLDARDIDREVIEPIVHEVTRFRHVTRLVGRSVDRFGAIRVDVDGDIDYVREAIREWIAKDVRSDVVVSIVRPWAWLGGYTLRSSHLTVTALREWHDGIAIEPFTRIAGVTELDVCGGERDGHVEVRLDVARVAASGLSVFDVITATRDASRGEILAPRHVPDPAEVCAFVVAQRGGAPVRLGDVATCSESARRTGCRAYDESGEVVSVSIYGNPSARASVQAAISQLAAPDVDVRSVSATKSFRLVMQPGQVAPSMTKVTGTVARVNVAGWLADDVLVDVPADRVHAVRDQVRAAGAELVEAAGDVAWVFGNAIDELPSAAAATQLGAPVPTSRAHWIELDNARLAGIDSRISGQQKRDLAQLVTGGLYVSEDIVLRVDGEADAGALVIAIEGGAPVRLGDVGRIASVVLPSPIWRVNGLLAVPVRPLPSASRDALRAVARDPNVKIEPMVHLP